MDKETSKFEEMDNNIYSNRFDLEVSFYDFAFNFKLANKNNPNGDSKSIIYMSPEHAKALYEILGKNLEKWEEKFGEINMPEEILDGGLKEKKGEN